MTKINQYTEFKRNQAGFTLMEILISLSILTIIMVIILQAFQLSNKAWQVGEKRIDEFQRTRIIMDQMNRELRGAYPFKFFQNSEEFELEDCKGNIEFIGESDQISFVTSERSLSTPESNFGFRTVTYYVDNDSGTEEEGLVVMENIPWSPKPFDEGYVTELDSSVTDIKFEYYICLKDNLDDPNAEEECSWIDLWNPCEESDIGLKVEEFKQVKTTMPKAVRITMTVEREKKSEGGFEETEEIELPPIVIPIYTKAIPNINPFGVSGAQDASLADILSGSQEPSATLESDIQSFKKESVFTPHQDDPQRTEEILRRLLSGEMNQGDK